MTIYYLMVKTHNITGLKYLCQTKNKNPHKYLGSGLEWIDHLKKYGKNVRTEVLLETTDKQLLNNTGRYYSTYYKITTAVDNYGNRIWANAIPETGGGPGFTSLDTSEYSKKLWSDPSYIEKMKNVHSELWRDQSRRQKQKIITTESQNRIEVKEKHRFNTTLLWENAEYRKAQIDKLIERWSNVEFKEFMSKIQRIVQNKPEVIEKKRKTLLSIQTTEFKKKKSDSQNRPEVVIKKSNSIKSLWKNETYRNAVLQNSAALTGDKNSNKNPNYDHTIYQFQHRDGQIEISTRFDLQMKYNLSQSQLSQVISGKIKTVRGWRVV